MSRDKLHFWSEFELFKSVFYNKIFIGPLLSRFWTKTTNANKFKTKSICNNGFSPSWDESFEFNLRIPELAFLEVILMDEDVLTKNDLLGYSYIPMGHIRPGYRTVSLYQPDGSIIPSASLLFHICIV